jgi:catechol 2,3-dioxygenase-like lactoylglutathione lyase family enzyme
VISWAANGETGLTLDHLILPVNDREESVRFYTEILGLGYEGEREPFSVVRVSPDLTLQIVPWGTPGGMHLAFAMPKQEFDEAFGRIRENGVEFGDSFHSVGNGKGPGREDGARGPGPTLYCFDPSRHLIEIRHYE